MRYPQGDGVNTSLSRLVYCTHVYCQVPLVSVDWCSFPICVRVSSVARPCATKDAKNKDNVWKLNVPAGINCPPPSKTISPITWFGTISTRLAGRSSVFKPGPCEIVFFIDDGISKVKNLRVPPRSEASPLEGELE